MMLSPKHESEERNRGGLATEVLRLSLPLLLLGAGVAGFLVLSNMRRAPALEAPVVRPPLVETVPVQLHTQGVDIQADGIVVPYREIKISAEVAGRVKHKAETCRAGNYVTAGTLLIEIDPIDYDLEVRRLTKELDQAQVMIEELDVDAANTEQLIQLAEEDVALQRRELNRLQSLSGDRYVTESKVDQAARSELAARNSLQTLQSQRRLLETRRHRLTHALELVGTQLEKAQLDKKRTKILAPADGMIVQELVEEDSYVQKGASLLTFEDTSAVEVKCNLRMKELYWVWQQGVEGEETSAENEMVSGYRIPPTPATILYSLRGREYAWEGVLSRYDGVGLDERTRTVPCRVVVDNPRDVRRRDGTGVATQRTGPPALVRGMFVKVILHTQPNASLLKIPERAVRPGNVVWIVEDGSLRRRKIQVSQLLGDGVLVDAERDDVTPGARVIVSPLPVAHDGMTVREKQTS